MVRDLEWGNFRHRQIVMMFLDFYLSCEGGAAQIFCPLVAFALILLAWDRIRAKNLEIFVGMGELFELKFLSNLILR